MVALANVGVLVWSLGRVDLSGTLVAPAMLVLAAVLAFVPMLANSLRLTIWSRFLGIDLGFRKAMKIVTGTMVTNSITPSAAGGVPIKLLFLIGEGVTSRRAATLLSFQTAEDALVLFSLLALSLAVSGFQLVDFLADQPGLLLRIEASLALAGWIVLGLVAVLALIGAALAAGLLGTGLRARAAALAGRAGQFGGHVLSDWLGVMRRGKGVALANIAIALAQWLVRFSMAGLVLVAFGETWHPALYWLLQYLVQSISSVVPTPGGAGGAEAGFLLLFAPFVAVAVLVPAMSTWRLLFFYLPLGGAALVFFLLHRSAARPAARAPQLASATPPPPRDPLAHPAE